MSIDLTLRQTDGFWNNIPPQVNTILAQVISDPGGHGGVVFSAYGKPAPWQAPKVNRYGRALPTPGTDRMKNWQKVVGQYARVCIGHHELFTGPVSRSVAIFLPKPDSRAGYELPIHPADPDDINLFKAVGDALQGIIYENDRQLVVIQSAGIFYEIPGLIKPGCVARYWEI